MTCRGIPLASGSYVTARNESNSIRIHQFSSDFIGFSEASEPPSEDENLCAVLESMKSMDLRVERLQLCGNRLRGLQAVTEYLWNCREPLLELDLSDNEIIGEPGEADGLSALLRCASTSFSLDTIRFKRFS